MPELSRFMSGPLHAWMSKRRQAVERVEGAYGQVLALQPAAPPRWIVASAARVGQLWADFAEAYHELNANLFEKTASQEEVSKWWSLAGPITEPRLDRARSAYEKCRDTAERYGIDDEFSQLCSRWLQAHPRAGTSPDTP